MRKATILSIGLALTAIGCGPAAQHGGDDLGGAPDLARRDQSIPSDLGTDGPTPDLSSLDAAPDLTPQPDLETCDGGNCTTQTCGSGQVLATSGKCVPIQSTTDCTAQHRQFVPVGLFGYCGDCLATYSPYFGFCVQPMCGGDGSLGALCKALGRGCDATSLTCQPCTNGATLDAMTGACVPTSCQARTDCPEIAGYYCTQLAVTDAPQCRKRPCPAGQTWDRTAAQACTACASCAGNEWPVTDASGHCYCTASPGWFFDHSTSTGSLEQCDEDGDGWLKETVKEELAHATVNYPAQLDYTVLLNVQCTIPYFTSVELHNEWLQTLTLQLTDIGQSAGVSGVAMYEDPANDTAGYVSATVDGSNSLSGSSVNSLTKACYSQGLDLNHNGLADYIEDQTTSSTTLAKWAVDYQPLTYFMELYHSHFEQTSQSATVKLCSTCATLPLPGVAGKLVIEEPRRCDAGFPMQLMSSTKYWQDCVRHRDNNYSASNQLAYDFAQYECQGTPQGACPTPAVPVGIQPADGSTPPHGSCNGGIATQWMGMTQYSQFMCGQINDTSTQYNNDVKSMDVVSMTQPNAKWEALSCNVTGESMTMGGPGTTASFLCTELPNGYMRTVTWLTRLYRNYATPAAYSGGCLDEAIEYPQLCPADPADAVAATYGQIACGPPCPQDEKMNDSVGTYVICLHPTLASLPEGTLSLDSPPAPPPAKSWSLMGEVAPGGSFGTVTNCAPTDGGVAPPGCWTLE
jgi:hypothetical protein